MTINGVLIPDTQRLSATVSDILKGKGGMPLYLSLFVLAIGFYAIAAIFIMGHGHTINTSSLVPWGLQISTYVYFVLISTGCTFVNFFGHIFFEKQYKPFASRIVFVAIVAAATAFLSLATELGRVDRMYNFLISPNPKSPMFWMSVWYTAYFIAIAREYIDIQQKRHSNRVLWGTFIVAILTMGTSGSLFGAVSSRFYYYGAILPIYTLFSAFLVGSALAAIIVALAGRKSVLPAETLTPFITMVRIGLAIVLVANICRLLMGLAGHGQGAEIFQLTLGNNLLFGIFLGIIVPWWLLTNGKGHNLLAATGVLILITQLKARNDLVVGGFKLPIFRAYDVPEVVHYTPSIYEVLVLVASISLVATLYIVCEKSGLFEIANKEAR